MTDQAIAGTAGATPPAAEADHLGGSDAQQQIGVLPPIPRGVGAYPVSARTGEPTRPRVLGVAVGFLLAGAVVSTAGLLKVLWDCATVVGYHSAATLLEWTKPNPVSFLTVAMVLAIGAIGAAVATAAGTVAYNAWNGRRWARVGGLVAVAVSALTLLLNPLAMAAMVPVAAGAGLLWTPVVARYIAAWESIRTAPAPRAGWADYVVYGKLPRYS